jgi:hypothetical protein
VITLRRRGPLLLAPGSPRGSPTGGASRIGAVGRAAAWPGEMESSDAPMTTRRA